MRALVFVVLVLVGGCGGGMSHAYELSTGRTQIAGRRSEASYGGGGASGVDTTRSVSLEVASLPAARAAPSFWFGDSEAQLGSMGSGSGPSTEEDTEARGRTLREEPPMIAQAQTSATPPEPTATDAVDTSRELLIYTALFHVGVYDIEASEAAIAESARSAGGFVFSQGDDTIVVRVPAAHFMAFVTQIDGSYDVLHRQIDAQDVGEEFRDVEIRIRNLEDMRERVAALLASAHDVEQALAVEQQLGRITAELESLRGRQRFLADRISFSTVTVMFRPQPHDAIDQPEVFQLPFAWLEGLGLPNLMELR
jgi:hypothetical protein